MADGAWIRKVNQGVVWLESPKWQEWSSALIHGFSTRHGDPEGEDFNLALHTGADEEKALANRQRFAEALGFPRQSLTAGWQVHGSQVVVVQETDQGRGAERADAMFPATDALVTREKGVPLATFYADCVPLLFFDPLAEVIGIAHAGWRGTVARIGPKTVEAMVDLGARKEDIRALIGPSIGPCCYQVDEVVVKEVLKVIEDQDAKRILSEDGENKWKLDLWGLNRHLLVQTGLLEEHTEASRLCPSCQHADLHSYRASGGRPERMAAVLMMKGNG